MVMDWYNPIKDWRILGPLMFKYEVETDHYLSMVKIDSDYTDKPPKAQVSFDSGNEESYKEAIIMCILKSENII